MKTMSFTIQIGILAGSIDAVVGVAARLGVSVTYAKVGGILARTYSCVAIGDEESLRHFLNYLQSIQGVL